MSNIPERIFAKDNLLWSTDVDVQKTIDNRLGWLDAIDFCETHLNDMNAFVEQIISEDFRHVILLGMGGSALAPEVFSRVFPKQKKGVDLRVLDTTCAEQILDFEQSVNLSKTLFIVSSKSGTTTETWALFEYFYERLQQVKGIDVGQSFVVITDQGSDLQVMSKQRNLRHCFINPSDIGGRFSALSYFGLLPAALLGLSLEILLSRAKKAYEQCRKGDGAGIKLGEWLVAGYHSKSLDKLQLHVDDELEPLVWWIEQLVAESLGKKGFGVLPFLNKEGVEKLFIQNKNLTLGVGSNTADFSDERHAYWNLDDFYDVAAHFFHWEFATAIAGARLEINPFDEPNVTEAKVKTKGILKQFSETELPLPTQKPLGDLLSKVEMDSYIAVLAYYPINVENYEALHQFRLRLEKDFNVPVTVNFGPRYLHSTGQLHKGGKQQGLFIVLTQSGETELAIPSQHYTFNTLCRAQALGDFQILTGKGFPAHFYALPDLSKVSALL
ncbi:MAG: hypothetical protein ACRBEE_06875 [Arenicella sp.]